MEALSQLDGWDVTPFPCDIDQERTWGRQGSLPTAPHESLRDEIIKLGHCLEQRGKGNPWSSWMILTPAASVLDSLHKRLIAKQLLVHRLVVFLLVAQVSPIFQKAQLRRPGSPVPASKLAEHHRCIHVHRTRLSQVRSMTAPPIPPRIQRMAQASGVQVNVPDQLQQIGIAVTENGFVAPLKEMPRFPIASIVVLRIGELEGLHGPGQRHGSGFDEQVHMVGHQDVGIQGAAVSSPVAFQPFEIRRIVGVLVENVLPAIPPRDHVIEGTGELHPRLPRHSGQPSAATTISQ